MFNDSPFVFIDDKTTGVKIENLHSRREFNRAILAILSILVDEYDDWRFNQLLVNVGLKEHSMTDGWHEEGKATLENLLKNDVVKRHFKKVEKVVDLNDFKNSKGKSE